MRIASIAGYVALKMHALIDRAPGGDDRDAQDIAIAMWWYQQSTEVEARLYETPEGEKILEDREWDRDLAAVAVLARDVASELGDHDADALRRHYDAAQQTVWAKGLDAQRNDWTPDIKRRALFLAELGKL